MTPNASAEDAQDGTPDEARRPGRPRDARRDEAILAATLEILKEQGYVGLTIERVAVTAGVGRPTIYRRWPSKPALVVAALVHSTRLAIPVVDTGSLRRDLIAVQRRQVDLMSSPDSRRVTAGLIADLATDPELAQSYVSQYLAPRRCMAGPPARRRPRRARRRRRLRPCLRSADGTALHASSRLGRAAPGRCRGDHHRRDPRGFRPRPEVIEA